MIEGQCIVLWGFIPCYYNKCLGVGVTQEAYLTSHLCTCTNKAQSTATLSLVPTRLNLRLPYRSYQQGSIYGYLIARTNKAQSMATLSLVPTRLNLWLPYRSVLSHGAKPLLRHHYEVKINRHTAQFPSIKQLELAWL